MQSRQAIDELLCSGGEMLISHSDIPREMYLWVVDVPHNGEMTRATIRGFKMLQRHINGKMTDIPCLNLMIDGSAHIKKLKEIIFIADQRFVIVPDDAFGIDCGCVTKHETENVIYIDDTFNFKYINTWETK